MTVKAARRMDVYVMAKAEEPAREEALRSVDEVRVPLRRYLMCAGASAADADDAVQETFLRLYRHLERGGDRSNLRGWIFQVARIYWRDMQKSARRHRSLPTEEAMEREERFRDPGGGPERTALDQERSRRLSAAIEQLAPQQREIMLLRAAGLRYREIAEVMGIQVSSVGTTLLRAMARLREELS